jgi:hypothetical protein
VESQVANAAFSGTVLNESGKPFAGVPVNYYRLPRYNLPGKSSPVRATIAPGEPFVIGTLTSGLDGKYAVGGIPGGVYRVCVGAPSDAFVSPCKWSDGRQVFVLESGGNYVIKSVTVQTSVKVHFTISDPQHVLPSGSEFNRIAIGVKTAQGAFQPAVIQSRDQSGFEAAVPVPHGASVPIWLSANGVRFTDQGGRALGLGAQAVITPAADVAYSWTVSR